MSALAESPPPFPRRSPSAPPLAARPVPPRGTLGIFAGSGPFDPARYEAGKSRLEALGFGLVEARGVRARQGFLAGPDVDRAAGIHELLAREDVDGLIAARGGYGLTRILDRLHLDAFRAARKPVVGFSDVTALQLLLLSHGVEAMHGPVVTQLPGLPEADAEALAALLRGEAAPPLSADGPTIVGGVAEGPVWGGNLAVLAALLGTPFLRPPESGVLLLLEDVGETSYRLDRLLTQLLSSGFLGAVNGVALGDFHDCRPAQPDHPSALEVLEERLGPLGVPVLAGLPIGHGGRNRALPLGRPARLDAGAGELELLA